MTNQDTTLTNQDELIEAEFKDMYPYEDMSNWDMNLFKSGYLSATKASEQRIQELEAEIKHLLADHLSHSNIYEQYCQMSEKKIAELTASNNQLRDALQSAFNNIEKFKGKWIQVPEFGYKVNKSVREGISHAHSSIFTAFNTIQNALSSTPTQSLAQHDNEVIERRG